MTPFSSLPSDTKLECDRYLDVVRLSARCRANAYEASLVLFLADALRTSARKVTYFDVRFPHLWSV